MTATLFDSPAWRGVFYDPDLGPLFTDTAELRANLLVMGTLALTQAKAGIVPDVSAQAIQRAAMEVQIDPAALSANIAETGDPVAALVDSFKAEMQAPEHANWVHHASNTALTGATGLSLRLRQSVKIIGGRRDLNKAPTFAAYHSDPDIRAGLASGLGLADGGDTDPVAAVREFAAWIAARADAENPSSAMGQAIQHQLALLNTAIQSAPPETRPMINMMTLPQMVLGLGALLD